MIDRVVRRLVLALLAFTCVPLFSVTRVEAGSGLNTFNWFQSNRTVSSSSFQYSNMAGFVQALVNSTGCNVTVDGTYGNQTTWFTAIAQNGIAGWNNGGVMNPSMWYAFDFATSQVFGPRKINQQFVDEFGTQYWSYYGGNTTAELGWNPFASQWLYSPYPNSNRSYLVQATTSRTPMSVPACS